MHKFNKRAIASKCKMQTSKRSLNYVKYKCRILSKPLNHIILKLKQFNHNLKVYVFRLIYTVLLRFCHEKVKILLF